MNIIIEKAKPCNLQEIADIEKEIFSTPWSLKNITATFENKSNCFFVAKDVDSGETVGHICLETVLDEGILTSVAVKERYRNKGIAKKLMDSFIREAKDRKVAFINLEVRASNTPAVSLYEKYGFEQVGIRKNYYSKPAEDAVLMTLNFDKSV